jgi:hypothetical protein
VVSSILILSSRSPFVAGRTTTPVSSTRWFANGARSSPSRGVSAYGPAGVSAPFRFWSRSDVMFDRVKLVPPPIITHPIIVTTLPLSDLTFASVVRRS